MLPRGLTTRLRQPIHVAESVLAPEDFGMNRPDTPTARTFAGWQPFYAPVALWLLCCGLAAALNQFMPGSAGHAAALAAVGAGAIMALRLTEIDLPRRLLLMVSMLPALTPAAVGPLGWVAAGALVAVVAARGHVLSVHTNDLHRHLSWCRRRGESAAVLTASVPASQIKDASRVVASFRITDSVAVHRRGRSFEIAVVLDEKDLQRGVVEQRLVDAVGPAQIGWASFPEDGVALVALLESAMEAARPVAGSASAGAPAGAGPSFEAPRAAFGGAED
jgi:hypothetical protein